MACGAHLQFGSLELGEELCSLARMGQKKMISCYKLAGADLNTVNMSRQTALHSAVETGQFKVVQFLIEHNIGKATFSFKISPLEGDHLKLS